MNKLNIQPSVELIKYITSQKPEKQQEIISVYKEIYGVNFKYNLIFGVLAGIPIGGLLTVIIKLFM